MCYKSVQFDTDFSLVNNVYIYLIICQCQHQSEICCVPQGITTKCFTNL